MVNGQGKMLRFYLEKVLNRFFPGVKGAALLIILPACFVVIIYFFENLTEIFTTLENDKVIEYEKKLASLKEDLPKRAVVSYVTDQDDRNEAYGIVSYILVPIRTIRGLKPTQDYLIVDYLNKTKIPKFKGYTLKRKYRNGIMLFERNN
jgi:hypothetical protein